MTPSQPGARSPTASLFIINDPRAKDHSRRSCPLPSAKACTRALFLARSSGFSPPPPPLLLCQILLIKTTIYISARPFPPALLLLRYKGSLPVPASKCKRNFWLWAEAAAGQKEQPLPLRMEGRREAGRGESERGRDSPAAVAARPKKDAEAAPALKLVPPSYGERNGGRLSCVLK